MSNLPLSGWKLRRERKRQKRLREQEQWREERSWPSHADGCRADVEQAIHDNPNVDLHFRNSRTEPARRIMPEDLSAALWAVTFFGQMKRGMSLKKLSLNLKIATGRSASDTKAAAILRTLIKLDLIEKTKNYCRGSRGNSYRRRYPGQARMIVRKATPPPPLETQPLAPDADADPWG